MRGRGHVPAFSFVAAQALMRWVASKAQDSHFKQHDDQEQQDEQQNNDGGEQRPCRRTGAGGAWRAFCAEQSKGRKMTSESLKQLARDYKNLSIDEHQHYLELGSYMCLEARWNRIRAGDSADAGALPVPPAAVSVVARPCTYKLLQLEDSSLSMQCLALGSDFPQRLGEFTIQVHAEKRAHWSHKTLESTTEYCFLI